MSGVATYQYLGTGWAFPVTATAGSGITLTSDGESAIRQSIQMIISTRPGERIMRPDFGCDIHDLVFGVNDGSTAAAACQSIRRALQIWEPRIDVLDVYPIAAPDEPRLLTLTVDYQVRLTNTRSNLVYPFYLR